jgi:hypothetical protein
MNYEMEQYHHKHLPDASNINIIYLYSFIQKLRRSTIYIHNNYFIKNQTLKKWKQTNSI